MKHLANKKIFLANKKAGKVKLRNYHNIKQIWGLFLLMFAKSAVPLKNKA